MRKRQHNKASQSYHITVLDTNKRVTSQKLLITKIYSNEKEILKYTAQRLKKPNTKIIWSLQVKAVVEINNKNTWMDLYMNTFNQ